MPRSSLAAEAESPRLVVDEPPTPRAATEFAATCSVSELAIEAAAVRRLMLRLRENGSTADHALIARLAEADDEVAVRDLYDSCSDRLQAVTDLAPHRRATSAKGMLFQLYIAAERITGLDDVLPLSKMPQLDQQRFQTWRGIVFQLLYSVASYVEAGASDDDLKLLRQWMLPPGFDALVEADRLMSQAASST